MQRPDLAGVAAGSRLNRHRVYAVWLCIAACSPSSPSLPHYTSSLQPACIDILIGRPGTAPAASPAAVGRPAPAPAPAPAPTAAAAAAGSPLVPAANTRSRTNNSSSGYGRTSGGGGGGPNGQASRNGRPADPPRAPPQGPAGGVHDDDQSEDAMLARAMAASMEGIGAPPPASASASAPAPQTPDPAAAATAGLSASMMEDEDALLARAMAASMEGIGSSAGLFGAASEPVAPTPSRIRTRVRVAAAVISCGTNRPVQCALLHCVFLSAIVVVCLLFGPLAGNLSIIMFVFLFPPPPPPSYNADCLLDGWCMAVD